MADWILAPCLVQLRAEFNAVAPGRDRASDGSIGDAAHQTRVSDHNPDEVGAVPIHDADRVNEVHAIDVDAGLRTEGLSMERVVQFLLGRCRSGAEKRLRYIIFNRRIWEASNGWKQRAYTGSNPHDKHAHFSASYGTAQESDTRSWHLEDLVAITPTDVDVILARDKIANPRQRSDAATNPTTTWGYAVGDTWAQVYNLRDQVAALGKSLTAAIGALAAKDVVDEQALAAALAPGLAAAVVAGLPADRDDITPAELEAAILGALTDLVGRAPSA